MSQGIATDFSAGDTEGGAETPDAQAGKAAAAEDAPADDPQGGDFPSRKGATRQDGAPASQSQRSRPHLWSSSETVALPFGMHMVRLRLNFMMC